MSELFLAHASCQEHPMSGQTPDLSAMLRRVAEIEVRGERGGGDGGGSLVPRPNSGYQATFPSSHVAWMMIVCPTDPGHCRLKRSGSV